MNLLYCPENAVGFNLPLLFPRSQTSAALLIANLSSIVFDYAARQKLGGTNLTFNYLSQFPVLPPAAYPEAAHNFLVPRVLELTYTSYSMTPFARDSVRTANHSLGRRSSARCSAPNSMLGTLAHTACRVMIFATFSTLSIFSARTIRPKPFEFSRRTRSTSTVITAPNGWCSKPGTAKLPATSRQRAGPTLKSS